MSNNTLRLLNNPIEVSPETTKAWLAEWESEHSELLQILLDAYCIVDLTGNIVQCNTAFETLVEQSQRKILKNPQFNHFLQSETTPEHWEQTFASGQTRFRDDEVSALVKVKNQETPKNKKLILAAVPIFSKTRERAGSLVTIRDVTDESNVQRDRIQSINKSNTDGLTQLCNKKFIEEWLTRQLEVAKRQKSEVSIMMGDVDHFKKVNDTYGHQAGDHVLRTVASCLENSVRKGDVAGRFGGEEFIVVMTNTDKAGALLVAERFRQLIEKSRVEFDGKVIPLTISLGTATFSIATEPGEFSGEADDKVLISRADLALYEAKHSGRNRTCQFETISNEKKTDQPKSK